MTKSEMEKEAERIVEEILYHQHYSNPLLESKQFAWDILRAVHDAAIEEAANIAYERMNARNAMNQDCCGSTAEFIEKDIRALKIGDDK